MPAQKPPDMSGDSDTRGSDHRARPKLQVMTIPDSIRPDILYPPALWAQGVTDRAAGVPAPVSLSSVGRSRANGRCSDGMSTPAARRDQDARSARRLGYVNTCRLRLMKPIPNGIDGSVPGLTGRRPAEKGPPGGGHILAKGGHPNSYNQAAPNLHRNKSTGSEDGPRTSPEQPEAGGCELAHSRKSTGPEVTSNYACVSRARREQQIALIWDTQGKHSWLKLFYDLRCHGIFAAVAS